VLVIDADETNLNRIAGAQRAAGRETIAEASYFKGLDRARKEFQSVSAILLAADAAEPDLKTALETLRGEFAFSKTPVILLAKNPQALLAEEASRVFPAVEMVNAAAPDAVIEEAADRARSRAGQTKLDAKLAKSLALEAAQTLREIAANGRTVFDFGAAEPALIGALASKDEELKITAASVLALAGTPTAQRSIAHVALDPGGSETLGCRTHPNRPRRAGPHHADGGDAGIGSFESLDRSSQRHHPRLLRRLRLFPVLSDSGQLSASGVPNPRRS
jgi:hypothetical protein